MSGSLTIPDSVTSIGEGAFSWMYSVTSLTIPANVTSIGTDAFKEMNGVSSVSFTPSCEAARSTAINTMITTYFSEAALCGVTPVVPIPPSGVTPVVPPVSVPPVSVAPPSPSVVGPVAPVSSRVVLLAGQKLGSVAKSGRVKVQLPVTEAGVKVTQQFVVSAVIARKLGLKVPRIKGTKGNKPVYARTVVIGTGSVISKKEGVVTVQVRLTAAAKKAFSKTKIKNIPINANITLTKNSKTSTLTKRFTLKR